LEFRTACFPVFYELAPAKMPENPGTGPPQRGFLSPLLRISRKYEKKTLLFGDFPARI
jgi:hypothetical protein